MLSQPLVPRKDADSSIMNYCRHTAFGVSTMEHQQSLTLHSHSCSGHSTDGVATMFAWKGSR